MKKKNKNRCLCCGRMTKENQHYCKICLEKISVVKQAIAQ